MTATALPIELNGVDRRIWEEELEAFVPRRVFDAHSHIYRWAFNTDPARDRGMYYDIAGRQFPEAGYDELQAADALLMPGREVHRLSFGFPFSPSCNFAASNRFVAQQTARDPGSAGLMLVHPTMTPAGLEAELDATGLLGLKPYRFYARSGQPATCPITDFLPEEQIEVADRRGLIVMLHISKRDAIADPDNIRDLVRLSGRYPRVRWILAHAARSYSYWAIEKAAPALRGLPNLWYDTSSICESDALEALLVAVGPERVMYGSDDLPVGVVRGKYIAFGFAWAFLGENNHSLNLAHVNPQMTFVRYEQLRAMRRAALRLGLSRGQIEDLFCNTAARLVAEVRG